MSPAVRLALLLCIISCSSHAASSAFPDAAERDATSVVPERESGVEAAKSADAGEAKDAHVALDAPPDVDKSVTCAATFGDALTNAFGRLDGTVLAVVPPADDACALPNSTHLVLQVTEGGAPYRMVLDVLSSSGNPDVFFYEMDGPLAAGAWSEGWHAGVALDYAGTLGIHSTVFTEMVEATLVDRVTSEIQLGAHVSVFATSAGESNSAHLIHRNLANQDGAIVLSPESASPHYLLFRFSEQTF